MPSNAPPQPFRVSQYIFGLQALPLIAAGIYTLIDPSRPPHHPLSPFRGLSHSTVQAMGLNSLALGTAYAIASYQNNLPFMLASIPGRLIAAAVFGSSDEALWSRVAPFEALMGCVTAASVWWEW
ncbi:hypothetical protein BO71DRAFT_344715 [Aspergillus ellipticus CBS 707.79]|uniref:Integral membrane protein n=1 Tax=Aspergillus ellipticus CBS 707.79 TaxID=1448320 RepID=A0A319DPJ8_9EURO|nr:hypothetical protein BO71DRAFT_344715 [Aspergillus ellipticus CBS 707.79]